MDTFGDPVERSLYFWIGGGHAHRLAAAYQAQVSSRWIDAGWPDVPPSAPTVSAEAANQFAAGRYPFVAVLGTPDEVEIVVARFRSMRADARVVFDGRAPSELATRAVILEAAPTERPS
jgi:hypothetical protein